MNRPSFRLLAASGITLTMGAMLILGFVYAGGPEQARRVRRDEQRSDGLSAVSANLVQGHVLLHGVLPNQAEYQAYWKNDLSQNGVYLEPGHPFLTEPPRYEATGTSTYMLCAHFETPSGPRAPYGIPAANDYYRFRVHGVGETCFDLKAQQPPPAPVPAPIPARLPDAP